LKSWLPVRAADSNKGNFGHVGVVAGSAPYAGAAILVARGALRAGCGLVTIFCTAELNPIFKIALPEATSVIVPSASEAYLDGTSATAIMDHAERLSVLAVGPGLGSDAPQHALLRYLLHTCKRPMVLDADAITLLSKDATLLPRLKVLRDCVLTPHPGEMGRLLGRPAAEVQAGRHGALAEAVQRTGVAVVLKGASTLIGKPDGQTWTIRGGTSALAKGGTGDVLTGVIASLMAQGLPGWQAAVVAASAHMQAGIACAGEHGERGVLASEVADYVPRILDRW
jgi:NAD(P)H-hydrate epimerase